MNARKENGEPGAKQQELRLNANPPPPTEKVYRVSELTQKIKLLLEDNIGLVKVEGEVSNYRKQSSGHVYFTLKDEFAQIDVVLFAGAARKVKVEICDGRQLRVFGQVTIYEKSRRYQIVAQSVEEAGRGSLHEAFEKLKAKLKAEGLFDRPKKRLPLLPQHIGIVTSPTGAAIRDMIKVLTGRFPNIHILLAPVRVQGEGAAQEIADALDRLNARGGLDVIIVGRGGGSLEDLWAFNEEIVARAIARSRIPVISAVGHETDFTISDFVADVRAPTPSAAAEMVIGQKDAFEKDLRTHKDRLTGALRQFVFQWEHRFKMAAESYVFREPRNLLQRHWQTLDYACEQMENRIRFVLDQKATRLNTAREQLAPLLRTAAKSAEQSLENIVLRIRHETLQRADSARHRVERFCEQLTALNPAGVLERGYSITRARGVVVRDAAQVALDEQIEVQLARGRLAARVHEKEEDQHGTK
jgi:exodeoxyribonuclease VII large subunit